MNVYIVVEGEVGEKKIYACWVSLVNPNLSYVHTLNDILVNHYSVLSAGGQSIFYDVVRTAIDDVNNHGNIDRFVIVIDSEDMTYQDKYDEVLLEISQKQCQAQIHIVIQHFCLETWALGNRRIGPRKPKNAELIDYKNIFDVLTQDPEDLPPHRSMNRAQFAANYLRLLLNDKNPCLTYSKHNPQHLLHPKFYQEVTSRYTTTGHIASFNHFLTAFA